MLLIIKRLYQLCIIYYILNYVYCQQSPCPNILEYVYDGHIRKALINVPNIGYGLTNINVTYNFEGKLSQGFSGEINLLNYDNIQQTIMQNGKLNYEVVFPELPNIPQITSILINNNEYCSASVPNSENNYGITTVMLKHSVNAPPLPGIQINPISSGIQAAPLSNFPTGPISSGIQAAPLSNSFPTTSTSLTTSIPLQTTSVPLQPTMPSSVLDVILNRGIVNRLNPLQKFANICGKQETTSGVVHLIINGQKVVPGEYPWMVALLNNNQAYICAGTLVTDKHVVTAAHCIGQNRIIAALGIYNISNYLTDDGTLIRYPKKIINHPEYIPDTGHADISLLFLNEAVSFSEMIRPICLWPLHSDILSIVKGIVTGWGQDESGTQSSEPVKTKIDIVSQTMCLNSDVTFKTLTSSTTLCAGGAGSGPCFGDSGSGMYVRNNNTGRWFLRGVVSTALGNKFNCDVSKYAVYVDVIKYLDWLQQYLL